MARLAGTAVLLLWSVGALIAQSGVISTVAGSGAGSYAVDGGLATSARLYSPIGVALDSQGNIYIADYSDNRIRRVDGVTGTITTYAGNGNSASTGDGSAATSASLATPFGVAVDGQGNLFIAEYDGRRIRRVDRTTGVITTVAGNGTEGFGGDNGPATAASLSYPEGVTVDGQGNLYIADYSAQSIRRVDGVTGLISTVVANGTQRCSGDGGRAGSASLGWPRGWRWTASRAFKSPRAGAVGCVASML